MVLSAYCFRATGCIASRDEIAAFEETDQDLAADMLRAWFPPETDEAEVYPEGRPTADEAVVMFADVRADLDWL